MYGLGPVHHDSTLRFAGPIPGLCGFFNEKNIFRRNFFSEMFHTTEGLPPPPKGRDKSLFITPPLNPKRISTWYCDFVLCRAWGYPVYRGIPRARNNKASVLIHGLTYMRDILDLSLTKIARFPIFTSPLQSFH